VARGLDGEAFPTHRPFPIIEWALRALQEFNFADISRLDRGA
jgi:hypothetical protein